MNYMSDEVKKVPIDEMVDLEAMKKAKFMEKHKPLTDDQLSFAREQSSEMKKQYTRDQIEIEKNLLRFLTKEEPLLVDGIVIGWVKDIPYFKLIESIPENLLEGVNVDEKDPTSVVKAMKKGQTDYIFTLMEELITIPKRSASEWKSISTPSLIKAFNDHIEKRIEDAAKEAHFF